MAETPESRPIDVEDGRAPFDHETATVRPAGRTLTELGRELEFFTPALMVKFGKFDRDPVIEAVKALGGVPRPYVLQCESPLFQGIGKSQLFEQEVDWDHRIYAIDREDWTNYRDMLAGFMWIDHVQKTHARTMFHELELVDPTALYAAGGLLPALPLFTITVFGVSSNRGFTYLAPALNPPHTRPFPKTELPRPDSTNEAQRLLGQSFSPALLSRHRKEPS